MTGIALYDEAPANLWALDHARFEPTIAVWQQIEGCLADYVYFKGYRPELLPEVARGA